jgi:outer membrane protein OmpA-like peptidoglycan-associated protein
MHKSFIVAAFAGIALATAVVAQENRVTNPSFEQLDAKIKALGEFEIGVTEWGVPEGCPPADIFTPNQKKPEINTPANIYGSAEPFEGNNYAGIRVYVEKEAEPRTYLQAKLNKPLVANKEYCVKFNVSLADLAKYASNNVGVYLSSNKIKLKNIESYEIKPQILHQRNKILDDQFDWMTVCATFTADGTEKYITIGNFAKQEETQVLKMKRPREYTQQQTRDAYYYIDDVSVIMRSHMDGPCYCDDVEDKKNQLNVVYTKNVAEDIDLPVNEQIKLKKLHFESESADLSAEDEAKLNNIAELLKRNPQLKLVAIGHADYIEAGKLGYDISMNRAKAALDYIEKQGISKNRLSAEGKKATEPEQKGETAQARAQNRRVEFDVR